MKKLGIAFGGSGAEGIACAAYVKALEEAGIKPDIVSGTGIGGVVAAMYASGMTYKDMADFINEIEFPGTKRPLNINRLKDERRALLDDMGLEDYFKMAVPVLKFDRLYFPLYIVAADMSTGAEVVFSEGDVSRAVKAGAAIPGIFSPCEIDGVRYIDGSCVNPLPFDIIRDKCDILVAIGPETADESVVLSNSQINVFSSIMAAYGATKKSLTVEKYRNCKVDFIERVLIEGISSYDFPRYEEIIESVARNAENLAAEIKKAVEEE